MGGLIRHASSQRRCTGCCELGSFFLEKALLRVVMFFLLELYVRPDVTRDERDVQIAETLPTNTSLTSLDLSSRKQ
jgi:hypothetical protein